MALMTTALVTGDLDLRTVFLRALSAIVLADGSWDDEAEIRFEFHSKGDLPKWVEDMEDVTDEAKAHFAYEHDSWQTEIGQGLPGIVRALQRSENIIEVSWSTSGRPGATVLHATTMVVLSTLLGEDSDLLCWEDEGTGKWHSGIDRDDLVRFVAREGGQESIEDAFRIASTITFDTVTVETSTSI